MNGSPSTFRLPPMPRISDVLRIYGVSAMKQLSQNFILDLNVTDKIARAADLFDCCVCEIGAGPGGLTRSVLNAGARRVAAVEIDKRFIPSLQILEDAAKGRLTIYHADIMKFNIPSVFPTAHRVRWESSDIPGVRMIGNLPFHVSIPLLLQWLAAIPQRAGPFAFGRTPMYLVFQKEVAENLTASPGSYLRSRLTVMSQYLCQVKRKYHLPNSVFVPKPKVDATLVELIPLMKPRIAAPYVVVEQVVKAVFSLRRKVIRTPLKLLFPDREELVDELLQHSGVDPSLRAHEVTLDDFDKLCGAFIDITNAHQLERLPLRVHRPGHVVIS